MWEIYDDDRELDLDISAIDWDLACEVFDIDDNE